MREIEELVPEAIKLRVLLDLYGLGLREIGDKIAQKGITHFSYEEIEKVVEARFEST